MKPVYTNIKQTKFDIGELKGGFKKFFENKQVVNFILTELNCRRDTVLYDEKMTSEQKEGALVQLRELVDFFMGAIAFNIQALLNKELKTIETEETKKAKLHSLKEKIKQTIRK